MATMAAMPSSDTSLGSILEQVAKEKGIDKKILVETIEAAILKAAQSVVRPDARARGALQRGHRPGRPLPVHDRGRGRSASPSARSASRTSSKHKLDATLGEELGFQVFWRPEDAEKAREQDKEFGDLLKLKQGRTTFGRIAAQTAKQVLLQRVRDAERDLIFNEYKDRKGELIRGIVRRFEKGNNIIVDLGKTEGVLPFREQTPRETYRPGDRIVAYVKDIDREARGPQVILSRSDPRLVEKLFEAEVPEIYEGIVRIVAVAREPGARSKIAVTSRDADVDPVGACVGMKGSRVQAVVQELRGEKIDIVPFDRDPARYVIAAIQPAEVHKVIVDEADGRMELVVPDEKLSLAIGRKGQNVRLAAQLTGWKLDIISETKFKQMEEEAIAALQQIDEVDRDHRRSRCTGSASAPSKRSPRPAIEELAAIPGLGGAEAAEQHQGAAPTRRWSASARSASSAAALADRAAHRSRAAALRARRRRAHDRQLLEEAGYQSGRGRAARGRGPARDPHRPRHQEGARHQAGRARLRGQRAEGARGGPRRRRSAPAEAAARRSSRNAEGSDEA